MPECAHHLPRVPRQVGSASQVPLVQGEDARSAAEERCHREDDRQASLLEVGSCLENNAYIPGWISASAVPIWGASTSAPNLK